MSKLRVSFVFIEYHSLDELKSTLVRAEEFAADLSYEIIVSSNSQYSAEKQSGLTAEYAAVKWVFNESNGGFGAGMNAGIKLACGEYIVISNPDALLHEGSLAEALTYLDDNPQVGVLGPKIIGSDGTLQDTCRPFMSLWQFVKRQALRAFGGRHIMLEPNFDYDSVQPVDWVVGGFMVVRRVATEKCGYFDEGYFLYVEDMDWCKAFWTHGFAVQYYPPLIVEYDGSRMSTKLLSSLAGNRYSLYHLKSYWRFLCKHGPFPRR
jgi:GT2 family glycosyltransferase